MAEGAIGMKFKGEEDGVPDTSKKLTQKKTLVAFGRKFMTTKGAWLRFTKSFPLTKVTSA